MNEKKKMKGLPKRILSFVLTLVMVLGMLPSMAMAAEANWDIDDYVVDDILYYLDTTTKTAALVEIMDDTLTELDVSTVEYEGVVYTVTDALDGVANVAPLTSINLPNVTTLDGATFAFLYDLTSVSLPKVITVGVLAFSECTSLESIDLPEATSIADHAFEGCSALESVSLPKVTSIGTMAFSVTALATLDLPEVTSIGNGAFVNNGSLASVSFPKVITIGNDAFKNCDSLSSITIPACTTSVGTRAFQGCDSLTSVVVTSKDTSIDAAAFTNVGKSATASLTLPSDWPETDRPDASGNWKGGKFGTVTYTGGTPVTHGGECFLYAEEETILCGVHGAVHVGDVLSAGMNLLPNEITNYLNETLVQEAALLYADATVTEVSGLVIKLENDMSTANPYAALKADAENYACGELRSGAEILASGIEAILQALPLDDLAYVGGGEDGEWTILMLDGSHYDVAFSEEHDFVEGVCDRCGASQGGGGTVTATMADLINAITGKKCVDIVDAGAILCASGYDNVVEFFQNNSGTIENVKKVSDTVWTFDWIFETHTVNIHGEEHSFEEGTCTKCHIDQTFTKDDMLAGLNGKECIKLIDSTIIASGYADVLAAIDELGELSDIMYSTDDGEYWAFCDEDEVDYVIYIYGEEHSMNGTECNVCGYKVTAAPKPLTFTADGAVTISLAKTPAGASYEYSSDGGKNWTAFTAAVAMTNGDSIAVRMNKDVKAANVTYSGSYYLQFKTEGEGTLTVSGDVMSLLAADTTAMPEDYAFYYLFRNVKNLTDASELTLPETTLKAHCYYGMFNGCTGLTEAPELPATTLANFCYQNMFNGCTGLTEAPELPATTLANNCYVSMFNGCTGLTEAPELPATILTNYCYTSMFNGCTGLTEAPELPVTTLANNCYENMFKGCTGLTEAPELPATTLANNCYENMFMGCTGLTEAPELPATTLAEACYSGMFMNCTGLTTAPELPATTLAEACYSGMFMNCTGLTTAPELPATTLANNCYQNMFMGCTGLTEAPELPATTLASSCYKNMFSGCVGLTTASELPATTLAGSCYGDMFYGCTGLTTAPELPAIELAYNCYGDMFMGCTGLTTAPELPATTLANNCYSAMFYGCTGLITAPELPATTLANNCYSMMFNDCTGLKVVETNNTSEATWIFPATSASNWNSNMISGLTATGTLTAVAAEKMYKVTAAPKPLTFTADGDVTISLAKTPTNVNYEYSIDGGKNWKAFPAALADGDSIAVRIDQKVKAADVKLGSTNYLQFAAEGEGTLSVSGDISSLLAADTKELPEFAFIDLFNGMTQLVDASKLVLPAATLAKNCYQQMFYDCSALTKAPKLPATTLATYCYANMFHGCTALTEAPELNASKMEMSCYYSMFYGCTGLTTAPALPATKAAIQCYQNMFYNCTSLTTAPALSAETLATNCCMQMFYGCTALTEAPTLPAKALAQSCYQNMFYGCTSLTTAPALPATVLAKSCYYAMFQGCTALTAAPALPAKALAQGCYQQMFYGCTALTEAPTLPAEALAKSCYNKMFYNCKKLATAPELPAKELADSCYMSMFSGCTSLTAAPKLEATTLANYCYENMFEGCTSLTTAPILPASTMKDASYRTMFKGCTSLTTAPALPATTLTAHCYRSMFEGCTSLTAAPELNATALQGMCYQSMFSGCTSLTAAPALPATTLKTSCYEAMFQGCTGLTTAPELPATTLANNCYSAMFYGCTGLKVVETNDTSEATWIFPVTSASKWNSDMISGLTATGTLTAVAAEKMYKVTAAAKEAAIAALNEAAGTNPSEAVKAIVADYTAKINNAATASAVTSEKEAGLAAIAAQLKAEGDAAAAAKLLADAKDAAKKAIADEKGTDTSVNVVKAAEDAVKAIDAAKTVEEVNAAKTAGIEAIRAAKAANELAAAKEAAIAALNEAAGTNPSEAVKAIVADYTAKINNATTASAVTSEKEAGLAAIAAQLKAEGDDTGAGNLLAALGNAKYVQDNGTTLTVKTEKVDGDEMYFLSFTTTDGEEQSFPFTFYKIVEEKSNTWVLTGMDECAAEKSVITVAVGNGGTVTVTVKGFPNDPDHGDKTVLNGVYTVPAQKDPVPDAVVKNEEKIEVPEKNEVVNITTEIKTNDLSAAVAGDLEKALKVTKEEKAQGVWVWMELTEVSAKEVDAKDSAKIEKALGDKTVGTYMDISVFKQVVGGDKQKVGELGEAVTIAVVVPENLRKEGRTYSIVYVHGDAAPVEVKAESYNNENGILTFKADKFSTYALAYTDKPVEPAPTEPNKSPATGEQTNVLLASIVFVSALAVCLFLVVTTKRYIGKYAK